MICPRRSLLLPALVAATACNPDQRLLDDWGGMYEVDRVTVNDEGCDGEGPDLENPPPYMELEGAAGVTAHLVELRACDSTNSADCVFPSLVTYLARKANEKTLSGVYDEWQWTGLGGQFGTCIVYHQDVLMERSGASDESFRAEVTTTALTFNGVTNDDDCIALMEAVADDTEACTSLDTYEGTRVKR